ncbi:MAG TPA: hypothetical protein VKT70_16280, partial [Stellaceae bacterium]|nr:hypothetical protein [Stellaceae bacterium]
MDPMMGRWRIGRVAMLLAGLMACPAALGAGEDTGWSGRPMTISGAYLAARHAQQIHDYGDAASFLDATLANDPGNLDLIRRELVLRVSEGHIAEAVPLARRLMSGEGKVNLADFVVLITSLKEGDFAAASASARALPGDGTQRFTSSLLLAWAEIGAGHKAEALKALEGLGEGNGVEVLKDLHGGMIADLADEVDPAAAYYERLTEHQIQPSWRVVEMAGNFYERHGRSEEARHLYETFAANGGDANLVAAGLARVKAGQFPARLVASAAQGAATALFDLASLLDRRETQDASLLYDRFALDLWPSQGLAQLLLGEIEERDQHLAAALDTYHAVDPSSPLSWEARLRAAVALDGLDRTDEAKSLLTAMAAERPPQPEPWVELGDIMRGRSRFAEAVEAYDQALGRINPLKPRDWTYLYSRGVAL